MKTVLRMLTTLVGCLLVLVSQGKDERPNVLFIICDDLNTHLSTSDYQHISTPAFDRLADQGMNFKRAYCQYPVCNSSRSSLLHSLYPESTRVISNSDDIRETRPGTVSMPQAFKESGYWTGAVGKVFHNSMDPGDVAWYERHEFDNEEMPMVTPIREAFEKEHGSIQEGESRKLWREFYPTIAPQTRGQKPGYGPTGLRDDQHKDGKNVRKIVEWIENEVFEDKPFFMACGIHKPHGPFLAPDKYFDLYPKEKLQFKTPPSNFWDQAPKSAMTNRYEGFDFEFGVENDPLRREYMQAYHACISFIDAQIGLIFDALEKNGHWDNTVVVLISDHGYHLGDHFMWGKVTLFEICNRVPMVIRAPGMTTPGSTSQGLTELVDIFPTLAELCGVQVPRDIQGKSLVPMLKDPSVPGKDRVYTVVARGQNLGKAVRTQRWRYTLWKDGEELYDLKNDIEELHNLVHSAEYKEILLSMRMHLAEMEKVAVSAAAP